MRRLLTLFLVAFSPTAHAADRALTVSAAASLTDAMHDIAKIYPQPLAFDLGASSTLARQIQEGAPVDVFISADESKMDQLAHGGLIDKTSRVDILSNALVIIVPSDSALRIASPKDLANPVISNIAIAEPQSVPAGIYAKEYLRKLKIWDRITHKLVPVDNVRSVLAAVESGNVAAGIVYKTDALISRAVKIAYEVPRAEGPRIVYPAVVVADSKQKAAAQKFVEFLRSEAAQNVFRRYGFLLP